MRFALVWYVMFLEVNEKIATDRNSTWGEVI